MRTPRPPRGIFALLPTALFCAACLVVGQEQPAGGDVGECPSVVFPPAGYALGEHDPSHVTVAVPAGCGIAAGGGRLALLVNGEAVEEWRVESGNDFTESAMLFRLRWGTNTIQLLLYPDGSDRSEAAARQTTSTFEVTGAFLTTSFCEHVLAWDGEESSGGGDNGDGAGPWKLDGRPFLRRHAQVCVARPSVSVTWPPQGYVFKKLGGGANHSSFSPFVRVRSHPPGRTALGLSIDSQGMHLYGSAYFVGLPLPNGAHHLDVMLATEDGEHRLTDETRVPFSVDASLEYEEDGAGPDGSSGATPPESACDAMDQQRYPQCEDGGQCTQGRGHAASGGGSCEGGCGAGRCEGGGCVCDPDVIGETCDHNLLSGTRYLPAVDPRSSGGAGRCRASLRREALSQEMEAWLDERQFPREWHPDQVVHLSLNDTSGFGVTLHLIAQVLSTSLRRNKTMVMHGPFSYFRHRGCSAPGGAADLTCYFAPSHAPCPPEVLWAAKDVEFTANYQLSHPWDIPARFNVSGGGVFFWLSNLSRYLMTPNRRLDSLLRRVKNAIGFAHPIMGVHVRHGDSCPKWEDKHSHLPGAKCHAFQKYVDQMEEMKRRYGVTRVFLCTDDPSVVAQLADYPQFDFVHLHFDRTVFAASDWAIELKLLMATIDRRLVAETSLLDIFLLSHADYMVGTLSSHFASLAYELSSAAKGYHPPYISLDYPWRGSLLSPVSFYDQSGATTQEVELNEGRRDFGKATKT